MGSSGDGEPMGMHMSANQARLNLQPLEAREVPATLLGPTRISYQDVDGDTVTVAFSKPILTPTNVNTIFTFNTGLVNGTNNPQQLQSINLLGIASASGTTIATSAVRSPINGGDGFANLGQIEATDLDIGSVTIDGDLGRIFLGNATPNRLTIGAISVHSMGRFGTSTGASSLESVINGSIGALRVKTDVYEAAISTNGVDRKIGSITVGGSLIGGQANNSGTITATGDIGPIRVTGDLQGGTGEGTGLIFAQKNISSVSIGGSLIGNGPSSAGVQATLNMGPVSIRGDVIGGSGNISGAVFAGNSLKQLTIGGSLIGGTGNNSGFVFPQLASGNINIVGDIVGSSGEQSGSIFTDGKLASVTVGGSVIGGSGNSSGQIHSIADMGPITIRGNVQGGTFNSSGNTESAGAIVSEAKLASATVGGSVIGGAGNNSGKIFANSDLGMVKIIGQVRGGSGQISGAIHSEGRLINASIGGSLVGGSGTGSGLVFAEEILSLSITGDIRGGTASGIADLQFSGAVFTGRIGTMTLGGSLIAGIDNTVGQFFNNGAIRVVDDIANLTIRGNIVGNTTNQALITAGGQKNPTGTTDLAIGRLTVGGRVERALIIAGVDGETPTLTARNADAQIGTVSIVGDWIASSLVAGVLAGSDGNFGSGDDVKMSGLGVKDLPTVSSRINSLTIGGQAYGTVGGSDRFGIVANIIGTVRVGGTNFPFLLANTNENISLGITGDLSAVEVPI